MPTDAEYEDMIARYDDWDKLRGLWDQIKTGDTPGWTAGRAFESLVIQMFKLDGGDVR